MSRSRKPAAAVLGTIIAVAITSSHAAAAVFPADQVALTDVTDGFAKRLPDAVAPRDEIDRAARADHSGEVTERAHKLCALMPELEVHGWRGLVRSVHVTRTGRTVGLELRISDGTTLTTHGQKVPAQALPGVAELHRGSPVEFDGTFVHSRTDCLQEQGFDDFKSLRYPAFSFRFTNVTPLVPHGSGSVPRFDPNYVEQLFFLNTLAGYPFCDRFAFASEIEQDFDWAVQELLPADQPAAQEARRAGAGRGVARHNAGSPETCDPITPAVVARLTGLAFGQASLLHE